VFSWISLVLIDPDPAGGNPIVNTARFGYFFGSLYAHATLAAAWRAFGPGRRAWRIPLALAWIFALAVAVAINIRLNGGPGLIVLVLCFVAQYFLLQIPSGGLTLAFGLQLRMMNGPTPDSSNHGVRFGIRHLLVVMLITGIILGVARVIVTQIYRSGFSISGLGDTAIFAILSVAAVIVTVPLLLAALMRNMAALGVILSLAMIATATAVELHLLKSIVGFRPDQGHFIAINVSSTVLILVVALIVRLNGYFLLARPTTNE
jgi:hypothetical protein